MTRHALAFAFALLSTSCTPAPFGPNGLRDPRYPVAVRYSAPDSRVFVSPDWRIDNYLMSPSGELVREKTDDEYGCIRSADYDGDGKEETYAAPRYVLRLVHRKNDAVMWSQMVPLASNEKDRNLDVVVNDYVEALSGVGFHAVTLASGKTAVAARQYAAKIVDKKPRKIGRFEGVEATIELANVDQLKLDPASRSAKIRLVFLHTDYTARMWDNVSIEVPLLLVFGLHSQPSYFDATSPDFDAFVRAFELKEAPH